MTMRQRVWRLSIVLAFLLVRKSQPTDVSTESPQTHDDQQYEVIDVAQQQSGSAASRSGGQTTRIFTTGEVDDSFWLKYLGEDFRHAVHLQVGGNDRYDGIYNMTEDRSAYKEQHGNALKANPVEETENADVADVAENDVADTKVEDGDGKTSTAAPNDVKSDMMERADAKNETNSNKGDVLGIDDGNIHFRNQFYNFDYATGKPESNKYTLGTKAHYMNSKYSPTHTYTQTQSQKYTKSRNIKRGSNPNALSPSVIVNLPDTQKTVHQLDDNDVPVVVKMPPVIYHSTPIYNGGEDRYETDANRNTDSDTRTHSHSNAHTHTYPDSHSHTVHAQDTTAHFSQQAQYTPQYPLPSYYDVPPYHAISYSAQDAYRSADLMTNEKSDHGTPGLDYIMGKSSSSYGSGIDYTRIGRSSQDLFNQGL